VRVGLVGGGQGGRVRVYGRHRRSPWTASTCATWVTRPSSFWTAGSPRESGNGAIVCIQAGRLRPIPFSEVIGKDGRVAVRMVSIDTESYAVARSYMIRLEKADLANRASLRKLAAACGMSSARLAPAIWISGAVTVEVARVRTNPGSKRAQAGVHWSTSHLDISGKHATVQRVWRPRGTGGQAASGTPIVKCSIAPWFVNRSTVFARFAQRIRGPRGRWRTCPCGRR